MLAYEIGLTTEQFWQCTPVEFNLMVQAYHRRKRDDGVYFREMYTLQYNQWQAEHAKNPAFLEPTDVLKLATDELPKVRKQQRGDFERQTGWTEEEIRDITDRMSRQAKRENNIAAQHKAEIQAQDKVVRAEQASRKVQGLSPKTVKTVMLGNLMLEVYEENPPMGPLTKEEVEAGGQLVEEPLPPKQQTHENNL